MTFDLFKSMPMDGAPIALGPGALVLPGYLQGQDAAMLAAFEAIASQAPLRHLTTPGGHCMSVATTNCGALGWVSSKSGYSYSPVNPMTGQPWPDMPQAWRALAAEAAMQAGYKNFNPDACLVNQYQPGAKMGLHQDRDEQDFSQPIVSVSLGLPAVFLFGGPKRSDKAQRVRLTDGDAVVWGGPTRLAFHGIAPLAGGDHPVWGARRINLTFRCAG